MKSKIILNRKRRFILTIFFIALFVLTAIFFVTKAFFFNKKENSSVTTTALNTKMERGQILDRNGEILAIQMRRKHISIYKPNLSNREETIQLLAQITGQESDYIRNKIEKGKKNIRIVRYATDAQILQIEELLNQGKLRGVSFEEALDRLYPLESFAAHILGYVNEENEGKGGVEAGLDDILYPQGSYFNSGFGNNVTLTIDKTIQFYTEEVAQKAFTENQADSVMFIVMDAKTGDILAYTARPTFNPNNLSTASNKDLIDLCSQHAFEPGSVFKIYSIGAALEAGIIKPNAQLNCEGAYHIHPKGEEPITIKCLGTHGEQNYSEVIKNSCNAGTAQIIEAMDKNNFYQAIRDFGFGQKCGLPIPAESAGLLTKPNRWSLRSKPTIAIGQEILTTALQITSAATVYTNEGKLLRPQIIKKIEKPDGSLLREYQREPIRQVVSPETAKWILSAMEQNTLEGTGKHARVNGMKISTKTGTAQVIDKQNRRYSDKVFYASTLAIFPTEDPQLIIYGGIMHPKGKSIFGAATVAPLIKELAIECIIQYNLDKESDIIISSDGTIRKAQTPTLLLQDKMPNLIGISKRDLLQLFKKNPDQFFIKGEGWVVKQDPLPGETITEETRFYLELQ